MRENGRIDTKELGNRIRQARTEKNMSQLELAEACGFKSSFAFRRAFKRIYGTSPSEYLKNKE